ncbi:hypothetical protein LINGRAHAP2_LOCUS12381 [Linum grandiflorum]
MTAAVAVTSAAEQPDPESSQPDISIPLLSPPRKLSPPRNDAVFYTSRRRQRRRTLLTAVAGSLALLLLLLASAYEFWPSDPILTIARLRLTEVKIHKFPILHIDITMNVTMEVKNADVYAAALRKMDVEVMYRGKTIGEVKIGKEVVIRAYATSYVEAEMKLNGIGVIADALLLIGDLKKGKVPFGTVVEVGGKFGFLWFGFPLKTKMSCEVLLNTHNQTIVRQSCYSL